MREKIIWGIFVVMAIIGFLHYFNYIPRSGTEEFCMACGKIQIQEKYCYVKIKDRIIDTKLSTWATERGFPDHTCKWESIRDWGQEWGLGWDGQDGNANRGCVQLFKNMESHVGEEKVREMLQEFYSKFVEYKDEYIWGIEHECELICARALGLEDMDHADQLNRMPTFSMNDNWIPGQVRNFW